jgi:hypothetical protein
MLYTKVKAQGNPDITYVHNLSQRDRRYSIKIETIYEVN